MVLDARHTAAARRASAALVLLVTMPAAAQDGDWPAYGRTGLGDRHSPLRQITRENVAGLQVAWRYRTGEVDAMTAAQPAMEATPVVLDGTMAASPTIPSAASRSCRLTGWPPSPN